MEKITHYVLPEHTNTLYKEEAISSIGLTRDIAAKINELVDAFNAIFQEDLKWKQTQEGTIRKGIVYMKDNLLNTLHDLLKVYDYETIRSMVVQAYGQDVRMVLTPYMFGARGDGVANDTEAIEKAIASLHEGDTLYFPKGTYRMTGKPVEIHVANVTFEGAGLIRCDYGFRPKASNFKAQGLRMEATAYSQDCRAFWINEIDENPSYIENFTFKDCSFKNFFYAIAAVGGSYNPDGTEEARGYPVRDVVIENCHSVTYTDQNAGHFQMIQVENVAYLNNRTYGGQNASSYNAIKGNGFLRVIGNYDHNNSYASCEIENASGNAVIANNTFKSKIWVDDSFDVVVNGNNCEDGISVTVGSGVGDSGNVVISGNVCKNIRCEQYGTYVGGLINNVNIVGNTVNGSNTHGIWVHGGAVQLARIANNIISGVNATNDIAIQRNDQLTAYVSGNVGNGKKFTIAGSGGKVFVVDNFNMEVSGNRDSLPASHLERAFNGIKIQGEGDVVAWRLGVNATTGEVTTTRY